MYKINKPVIDVAATAANIKACRIRAGYKVREIQNIFNFSTSEAIYSWERGNYLPSIDSLRIQGDFKIHTCKQILVSGN